MTAGPFEELGTEAPKGVPVRTLFVILGLCCCGCVLSCCGYHAWWDRTITEHEVIIGGSPVRIESRPNKKEGFGREYYLVAIGPDGEVARYFLKLHPPTSITAFAAENDMIGVVVIQWQSIEETRWYVWDGYESRLEEHGNDFRISKYYDRLKAAHPELPD